MKWGKILVSKEDLGFGGLDYRNGKKAKSVEKLYHVSLSSSLSHSCVVVVVLSLIESDTAKATEKKN